jgi:hypothetical protein
VILNLDLEERLPSKLEPLSSNPIKNKTKKTWACISIIRNKLGLVSTAEPHHQSFWCSESEVGPECWWVWLGTDMVTHLKSRFWLAEECNIRYWEKQRTRKRRTGFLTCPLTNHRLALASHGFSLDRVSWTFCSGLASNGDPPDHCLPSVSHRCPAQFYFWEKKNYDCHAHFIKNTWMYHIFFLCVSISKREIGTLKSFTQ